MLNIAQILAETAVTAEAVTAEAVTADSSAAAAGATRAAGAGDLITTIVMMVAMVAVFYFLLIRPQRKKDKAVKNMLNSLKVGDRICTIGGFYGTIAAIKDDTITLTMGSLQNTVVIKRSAVGTVENIAVENEAAPEI